MPARPDKGNRIYKALQKLRADWTLCFIGEDQPAKLGELTSRLRHAPNPDGEGKKVPSGYSYWGIIPAVAWNEACQDKYYTLMRESIKSFPGAWRNICQHANQLPFHYASLGPGSGEKDRTVLESIIRSNDDAFYFPIDMSPEMLRIGISHILDISFPRENILPLQIDFSISYNITEISLILEEVVGDEPILFSLLGNTLSNFEDDLRLLQRLSRLLRKQDRLLLEVAYTKSVDQQAANDAASEYNASRRFKYWASSSLVQNTNLPVEIDEIFFSPSVEAGKSVLIKTIYKNTRDDFKMRVGDGEAIMFPAGDTILLQLTRKYSKKGINKLIGEANLRQICSHDVPHMQNPNFGSSLILLSAGQIRDEASSEWDFFIAYPSADRATADRIFEALSMTSRVFLDHRCISYGDAWHHEIAQAQAKSKVTIVLVSRTTGNAYYQKEEIAAAISMARREDVSHRVVPIYIGEQGDDSTFEVPYGLRVIQSADLRNERFENVIENLLLCLTM